jgi:hypothetical protein
MAIPGMKEAELSVLFMPIPLVGAMHLFVLISEKI